MSLNETPRLALSLYSTQYKATPTRALGAAVERGIQKGVTRPEKVVFQNVLSA